jgi:transcription elongation factor S-II
MEMVSVELIRRGEAKGNDTVMNLCAAFEDRLNSPLRLDVLEGVLSPLQITNLTDDDLINPELRRKRQLQFQERNKDKDIAEIKKAMRGPSTDMFQCKRCKARDCSYEMRQTRSGDEPMTVCATCNNCGAYFRVYQ